MKLRYPLAVAFVLVLWAWASNMDYHDQMAAACEAKGGDWNGQMCVKEKCHD